MWHAGLSVAFAECFPSHKPLAAVGDEELLVGREVSLRDEGHDEVTAVHDSLGDYVVSDAVVVDESVADVEGVV